MSVSPAGVGSPSILARALPSPLSWASPVSDYNDDFLSRHVASLTPGTGFPRTSTPVPINTPPAGAGTPSSDSTLPSPTSYRARIPRSAGSSVAGVGSGESGRVRTPPLTTTPRGRPTMARKQPRRVPRQNTPSSPSDAGSRRRSSAGSRRGRGGGGGGGGRGGSGGGGGGSGGSSGGRSGGSGRRGRRLDQDALQRQLEILLNNAGRGRHIAGVTTTNTITTTYKDGGRPEVTRNSTSVQS